MEYERTTIKAVKKWINCTSKWLNGTHKIRQKSADTAIKKLFIRLFKRLIFILFIYLFIFWLLSRLLLIVRYLVCKRVKLYGNERRHHLIVCFKF